MRHYPFELPLNVPWFTGHLGQLIDVLVAEKLWPDVTKEGKIPPALARRLAEALAAHHGVTITQEDLDTVPDDVWGKVEILIKKMKG